MPITTVCAGVSGSVGMPLRKLLYPKPSSLNGSLADIVTSKVLHLRMKSHPQLNARQQHKKELVAQGKEEATAIAGNMQSNLINRNTALSLK